MLNDVLLVIIVFLQSTFKSFTTFSKEFEHHQAGRFTSATADHQVTPTALNEPHTIKPPATEPAPRAWKRNSRRFQEGWLWNKSNASGRSGVGMGIGLLSCWGLLFLGSSY